ncbi:hypothetical protein ACLKA6_015046 [Drosophila palustris]
MTQRGIFGNNCNIVYVYESKGSSSNNNSFITALLLPLLTETLTLTAPTKSNPMPPSRQTLQIFMPRRKRHQNANGDDDEPKRCQDASGYVEDVYAFCCHR